MRRRSLILTVLTVVVVVAILVGILVSNLVGLLTGAAGLALTGVWLWLTAQPPKSGSSSNPGAINFGR